MHILFILLTFKYINIVCGLCYGGSYLNLCGICVEGNTWVPANEGLDKCLICGGHNSCVGCDGIVNSGFKLDACGECRKRNSEAWNDCVKLVTVYPNVVDRSLESSVVVISIRGAGLSADNPVLSQPKCHATPGQNQIDNLSILATSMEDGDLELKIQTGDAIGRYAIHCDGIDGSGQLRIVNSNDWDVIKVQPAKLTVDATYQLELDVEGKHIEEGVVWCFLRCVGSPTQVRMGSWRGGNTVMCDDYTPRLATWCYVGVSATEEAADDSEVSGAVVRLPIYGTAPRIVAAEYNQDLGKLLIRFNANIQLTGHCSAIFSEDSFISLDPSDCIVSGDVLAVPLKPEHPLLPVVTIIEGNSIRRMGTSDLLLAPECEPVTVPVSSSKVLPPNLSLEVPSIVCHDSEELRISSIGQQKLKYLWIVPPPPLATGSQRENLITWQSVRQLEKGLNNADNDKAPVHASELLPEKEYEIQVRGTNALGDESTVRSALKFSPNARASVVLIATPAVTALLAEANLTLCMPLSSPLHFQWFLNDEHMPGGGRLVFMSNLQPGDYNISCIVSIYNTEDILAASWVLTQVLPSEEKALLSPAEQVVGTKDSILIHAYTPNNMPAIWRCTTSNPLPEPCLAHGPDFLRVEDLVENNRTTLIIAPELLPVGKYIWQLENTPSTEAVVIVRGGLPPLVRVHPMPPLVDPSHSLQLLGEGKRLHVDCVLRWTTVFRLGFNYFNLQEDVGLGDAIRILPEDGESAELPLVVPSAMGQWSGLMSESRYLLRLVATCPDSGSAHADLPITVNVPPSVEPLHVSPQGGLALLTEFIVSGGKAMDIWEHYPLRYVWSVHRENEEPIIVNTGATARSFHVLLPPGEVTMHLKVCDVHGTCGEVTSDKIQVISPASVSSVLINEIKDEIKYSILEGSTTQGLGKSAIALQSLKRVLSQESELQIIDVSSETESAIFERANYLIKGLSSESLLAATSLEFVDQVLDNVKHLRSNHSVLVPILQLSDVVSELAVRKRKKRSFSQGRIVATNIDPPIQQKMENVLKVGTAAYLSNPSDALRNSLLNHITEAMGKLCNAINMEPVKIETELLKLQVSPKLKPDDFGSFLPANEINHVQVMLNTQMPEKRSYLCLAIAVLDRSMFPSQNFSVLNKVYEIRLAYGDGSVLQQTSKSRLSVIRFLNVALQPTMKCKMWTSSGWKDERRVTNSLNGVECTSRLGYSALTVVGSNAPDPTPRQEPSSSTASSSTSTSTATMTTTTTTTTTSTTTTPSIPITSTTFLTPPLVIPATEPTIPPSKSETPTPPPHSLESFGGAQFTINEDFNSTVNGQFELSMKEQVAKQLKVSSDDLHVTALPGSIVVTVYFLTTMDEDKAAVVVRDLAKLVETGNLKLLTDDNHQLSIPNQNLTLILPPIQPDIQAGVLRSATYAVVGVSFAIVLVLVVTAARGEKRESVPRISRNNDMTPFYVEFQNDFSLEGSSASLAKYRTIS